MTIAYVNQENVDEDDELEEIQLSSEAAMAVEVLSKFCIFGEHGADPEYMAYHVKNYFFAKTMNDLEGNGELEH